MELVTVIVAAYNVEKYILRCIDSLISQTYTNIEVLIVDDGSSDSTGSLLDEIAKSDFRLKVFHKENGGLSDARNYGLDRMTGVYVTFVDADDFVPQNYIEYLVSIIQEGNSDIAVVRTHEFYDEKDIGGEIDYHFENLSCDEAVSRMLTRQGIAHTACGKMYKNHIWKELRFPYGKYYEDYYTTFDAFSFATDVAVSAARIYYYFQRPASIMHDKCNERTVSIVEATEIVTPRIIEYWPDLEIEALDLQLALCLKCYQKILNESKEAFLNIQHKIESIVRLNAWKVMRPASISKKDKIKILLFFAGKRIFLSFYNMFDGTKHR